MIDIFAEAIGTVVYINLPQTPSSIITGVTYRSRTDLALYRTIEPREPSGICGDGPRQPAASTAARSDTSRP